MTWVARGADLPWAAAGLLTLTHLTGCSSTDHVLGEFTGQTASFGGEAVSGGAGAPIDSPPIGGAAGGSAGPSLERSVNAAVWVSELGEAHVAGYLTAGGAALSRGFVARVEATGRRVERWTARELWGLEGCGRSGLVAFGREAAIQRGEWTPLLLPPWLAASPPQDLLARACDDLLFVGQDGVAAHRDGEAWIRLDSGTSATLHDLAALDGVSSLAVGEAGTLLRRTGADWLPEASPVTGNLHSVWAVDPVHAYAVGGDLEGGWLILARGSEGWQLEARGPGGRLRAVGGDGRGRLIAIGEDTTDEEGRGLALARAGDAWVRLPLQTPRPLYDLAVPPYAFAIAVGPDDGLVRFSPRPGGGVAQLPRGDPGCGEAEIALLAFPLLPGEACLDTTAALPVACIARDRAALVGAARCWRHQASSQVYFTRAPQALLSAASGWEPCTEPLAEPCQSRRCAWPAPLHLCSPTALCQTVSCGQGAFDERGCLRAPCSDDEDCAPGERCAEVTLPAEGDCFEDHEGDCACSAQGGTTEWRCSIDD